MLPKRQNIILGSASSIRAKLLANAGLDFDVVKPSVDETQILDNCPDTDLEVEEIALNLAHAKAKDVSARYRESIVIGADQVLVCGNQVFSKAKTQAIAKRHLEILSGATHRLITSVVVYENGRPAWQHTDIADLTMRAMSAKQIDDYLDRNWPQVQYCVGCYMLENQGSWLFSNISGDYFTVLGLPLLNLLGYLSGKGVRPS